MSEEKEDSFRTLRIYDETEEIKKMPKSSGVFSHHGQQEQHQVDGAQGMLQLPPCPSIQHDPVCQEMHSMTQQQWDPQAQDASGLQSMWFSEAEPEGGTGSR